MEYNLIFVGNERLGQNETKLPKIEIVGIPNSQGKIIADAAYIREPRKLTPGELFPIFDNYLQSLGPEGIPNLSLVFRDNTTKYIGLKDLQDTNKLITSARQAETIVIVRRRQENQTSFS